jgi:hypothetical protein
VIFPYGSPEWLNELRLLLGVGFFVTLALALLMWEVTFPGLRPRGGKRADGRRESTTTYCPLHRGPVGKCPEGSHDS